MVLTPLQAPASPGNTAIRVEKNIHSFGVTCDISPRQTNIVVSQMSQICAVPIGYLNVVHRVRALQLKICEVNVDDIALSSLDGLPLVKVIGVVSRIVWR